MLRKRVKNTPAVVQPLKEKHTRLKKNVDLAKANLLTKSGELQAAIARNEESFEHRDAVTKASQVVKREELLLSSFLKGNKIPLYKL